MTIFAITLVVVLTFAFAWFVWKAIDDDIKGRE